MNPTFIQVISPNKLFAVYQSKKANVIAIMLALVEKYGYEIKVKVDGEYVDNLEEVSPENLKEQLELLKRADEVIEMSSYSESISVIEVKRVIDGDSKIKQIEKLIHEAEYPSSEKLYEKFVSSYSRLKDDEKRRLQIEIINALVEGGL